MLVGKNAFLGPSKSFAYDLKWQECHRSGLLSEVSKRLQGRKQRLIVTHLPAAQSFPQTHSLPPWGARADGRRRRSEHRALAFLPVGTRPGGSGAPWARTRESISCLSYDWSSEWVLFPRAEGMRLIALWRNSLPREPHLLCAREGTWCPAAGTPQGQEEDRGAETFSVRALDSDRLGPSLCPSLAG